MSDGGCGHDPNVMGEFYCITCQVIACAECIMNCCDYGQVVPTALLDKVHRIEWREHAAGWRAEKVQDQP